MRKLRLILLGMAAVLLASSCCFFQIVGVMPWSLLNLPAHYLKIAQKGQPIVAAIYEYKRERGHYPLELDELVPEYLPTKPGPQEWFWQGGILSAGETGFPHTGVAYVFTGETPGWESKGDFGTGRINLPPPTTTRPVPTPERLERNTLDELLRRVQRSPRNLARNRDLVSYLVSRDSISEARRITAELSAAVPDHWWPRLALAMLEADAPDAGHDFSDWVKANPCFEHYWYLSWYYRETGRKDKACEALADGAKYPLSRQNAPAFALQSFAYDAAAFAYRQERYQLTLDICDRWQAVDGLGGYAVDKSYLPMRAAAQLRLGHLEEARKTLALRTSQKQAIWARGVDELAAATDLGDRGFVYDPHEDESTAFKVFEWPPDDQ